MTNVSRSPACLQTRRSAEKSRAIPLVRTGAKWCGKRTISCMAFGTATPDTGISRCSASECRHAAEPNHRLAALSVPGTAIAIEGQQHRVKLCIQTCRQMLSKVMCPFPRKQAREQPRYRWQSVDGEQYEASYPASQPTACRTLKQFVKSGLLAGFVPTSLATLFSPQDGGLDECSARRICKAPND